MNKDNSIAGTFIVSINQNPENYTIQEWADNYFVPLGVEPTTNLAKLLGEMTVGGQTAYKFSVFQFDRHEARIGIIKNGNLYNLSFDEINPNDPNFDENSAIYKQMLSTFEFTKKENLGQFCGGIANISCPEGFSCILKSNYPDASGTCVKN